LIPVQQPHSIEEKNNPDQQIAAAAATTTTTTTTTAAFSVQPHCFFGWEAGMRPIGNETYHQSPSVVAFLFTT